MRRARHTQRDLFDQATLAMELQPDVRMKLSLLLQALLGEAAGAMPCKTNLEHGGKSEEGGDDQDHA